MSTPLSLISTADIEKALGYVDPMPTTVAMRGVLLPTPPDAIQTEFTGFSEHELPAPVTASKFYNEGAGCATEAECAAGETLLIAFVECGESHVQQWVLAVESGAERLGSMRCGRRRSAPLSGAPAAPPPWARSSALPRCATARLRASSSCLPGCSRPRMVAGQDRIVPRRGGAPTQAR